MPYRRQFLSYSGAFALATFMTGCGSSNIPTLQIKTLKGSISPQLIATFRRKYPNSVGLKVKPVEQLGELFSDLQKLSKIDQTNSNKRYPWQQFNSSFAEDLLTLGHGWLHLAIAQKLIQPLPLDQLDHWRDNLDPWQSFIRRNTQGQVDPQGAIWGQPYRWGTTLILYRKDKLKPLGWVPQDWDDLWREEIGDRLSLLDHSREVIGLVLKKLGRSYNEPDPFGVPELEAELKTLHQNVKFYSSTHYLEPLIIGDTWIAQAWSQDAIALLKRYPNLGAVIPSSGTALWCDLWVQPRESNKEFEQLSSWLNFCWDSSAVNQFGLLTNSSSPLIYQTDNLDPDIKKNPLIWVDPDIFQRSELIYTLDPTAAAKYQKLWKMLRQT